MIRGKKDGKNGRGDCRDLTSGRSIAEKEKKKGKAKGEFIIGKKKEWEVQECELISREEGGMIMTEFKWEEVVWKIVLVYETQGGKNLGVRLDDFIGVGNVENIIIGRDFNVRIDE